MRFILGIVVLGSGIALAGCFIFAQSDVKLTYLNSTDSLLCTHHYAWRASESRAIEAGPGCSAEVKPRGKTTWHPGCGDGPAKAFDLTVVLTVASDGREIYNRTANCSKWNDANATLIIEQQGREFVVSDSLPEG